MYSNDSLRQELNIFSAQHEELKANFLEFTKYIQNLEATPEYLKHLSVVQNSDLDLFEVNFAGKRVVFHFSSTRSDEKGMLNGVVKYYNYLSFPEEKHLHLGEFTFRRNGETNLTYGPEEDNRYITHEDSAIYIVMSSLNKAISSEMCSGCCSDGPNGQHTLG